MVFEEFYLRVILAKWAIALDKYFLHSLGSVNLDEFVRWPTWELEGEIQTDNFDAMKRKEIGQSVAEGNLHF